MSTHREIEEVYLEDINKKQKMSKGIVAESLGEMNKMGGEMKYCCDELRENVEDTWNPLKFEGCDHFYFIEYKKWLSQREYDLRLMRLRYCPFCGKKLKSGA